MEWNFYSYIYGKNVYDKSKNAGKRFEVTSISWTDWIKCTYLSIHSAQFRIESRDSNIFRKYVKQVQITSTQVLSTVGNKNRSYINLKNVVKHKILYLLCISKTKVLTLHTPNPNTY